MNRITIALLLIAALYCSCVEQKIQRDIAKYESKDQNEFVNIYMHFDSLNSKAINKIQEEEIKQRHIDSLSLFFEKIGEIKDWEGTVQNIRVYDEIGSGGKIKMLLYDVDFYLVDDKYAKISLGIYNIKSNEIESNTVYRKVKEMRDYSRVTFSTYVPNDISKSNIKYESSTNKSVEIKVIPTDIKHKQS